MYMYCVCVFLCHWLKTVFVLGRHIFIALHTSNNDWGITNSFEIRYDVEQCEFGEWKMGHCSKTCGGGQKTDKRALLKPSKNTTTCGPLSKISACNVQSCTYPTCKKVEFSIRGFAEDFLILQDTLYNDRVFYYGSKSGFYLYSLKGFTGSSVEGSWAIATSLGNYYPLLINSNCKAAEDPGNGSCRYGWQTIVKNGYKSNLMASVSCKEFD